MAIYVDQWDTILCNKQHNSAAKIIDSLTHTTRKRLHICPSVRLHKHETAVGIPALDLVGHELHHHRHTISLSDFWNSGQ